MAILTIATSTMKIETVYLTVKRWNLQMSPHGAKTQNIIIIIIITAVKTSDLTSKFNWAIRKECYSAVTHLTGLFNRHPWYGICSGGGEHQLINRSARPQVPGKLPLVPTPLFGKQRKVLKLISWHWN
jgi:hypothetical protein